jgi:hypothetical protein
MGFSRFQMAVMRAYVNRTVGKDRNPFLAAKILRRYEDTIRQGLAKAQKEGKMQTYQQFLESIR